jgi:hypothetical protein
MLRTTIDETLKIECCIINNIKNVQVKQVHIKL